MMSLYSLLNTIKGIKTITIVELNETKRNLIANNLDISNNFISLHDSARVIDFMVNKTKLIITIPAEDVRSKYVYGHRLVNKVDTYLGKAYVYKNIETGNEDILIVGGKHIDITEDTAMQYLLMNGYI